LLVFDDAGLVVEAALAGLGLAYLIEEYVTPLLEAGDLTGAGGLVSSASRFFLCYPGRRWGIAGTRSVHRRDPRAGQDEEGTLSVNGRPIFRARTCAAQAKDRHWRRHRRFQ